MSVSEHPPPSRISRASLTPAAKAVGWSAFLLMVAEELFRNRELLFNLLERLAGD